MNEERAEHEVPQTVENPKWREQITRGIEYLLAETYPSMVLQAESADGVNPVTMAPDTITTDPDTGESSDPRSYAELPQRERDFINATLLSQLGIDPAQPEVVDSYEADPPPDDPELKTVVRVLAPAQSEPAKPSEEAENPPVFVHEITYTHPDGTTETEYFLAPKDYRL